MSTPAGSTADVHASLGTLKDVAGIMGSFVFTGDGQLVAREIPQMFDDGALAEASSRLSRLKETFAAVGDDLELAMVRFRDHKLYLKVIGDGMLCIVAEGTVNMPALRMAANLVGRRISPVLSQGTLEPLPIAAAVPTPVSPQGSGGLAPPGMRRFRGRPVE